jgi:hypothetical protein
MTKLKLIYHDCNESSYRFVVKFSFVFEQKILKKVHLFFDYSSAIMFRNKMTKKYSLFDEVFERTYFETFY